MPAVIIVITNQEPNRSLINFSIFYIEINKIIRAIDQNQVEKKLILNLSLVSKIKS